MLSQSNIQDINLERFVCVFPGSASQYVGMGKSFCRDFQVAAKVFSRANDVLGYDITQICLNGKIVELNRIKNSLLAVYITSVAYYEVLKLFVHPIPIYMAGHSLGEYTALTCAGAISFEEGLKIVQYRAQLAEEISQSQQMGMTIVKGINPSDIENLCSHHEDVSIGCYNSQSQVLITGNEIAIQKVEKEIHHNFPNAQLIPLVASPAFHSPLLKQISEPFRNRLEQCQWMKWNSLVISNVSASPYFTKEEAINKLTEQLYKPVQWIETMHFIQTHQIKTIIEVGPQSILKQLNPNPNIQFYSMDDPKDRKLLFSEQKQLV